MNRATVSDALSVSALRSGCGERWLNGAGNNQFDTVDYMLSFDWDALRELETALLPVVTPATDK